jgi:uncharacterized protein (TIGR03437 family)
MGRNAVRLAAAAFLFTPVVSMAQVKVAPGAITTIAGSYVEGYTGDGAAATSAELSLPFQAIFTGGNLYIADQFNNVIRYVVGGNGNISTIAGNGIAGFTKDGITAITSELASPSGVWLDGLGDVYIADTQNSAIRRVAATTGIITTVAGTEGAAGYQGDGFGALSAELLRPSSIVFDSAGNFYIADSGNNVIRKVTASTGNISTYAGDFNTPGYTGDGKPATAVGVGLNDPVAIAIDSAGNLYIADTNNNVIRKVTASTGIITTIAGNGTSGFTGDGGTAVFAQLSHPKGVAVDSAGNVYIADTFNQRIRRVTPNGIISTVVGTGATTNSSLSNIGDGGLATAATLNYPAGLSIDTGGNIYIADTVNNVIRQYAPPAAVGGSLPVINSGGVISAGQFGAFPAIAPGSWIEIYGSNLATSVANWPSPLPNGIAPTTLNGTTVSIGGLSAFIDYVSPNQVNVQVPAGLGTGSQQLFVATAAGQSTAYTVTVNGTEAGLLAPNSFSVGGIQYVAALHSNGTYVMPTGAVSGITSSPAAPGETITMYGVGFGPVNQAPPIPAGEISTGLSSLTTAFSIFFGPTQASVPYFGLAPGYVGLYQFNVVVPLASAASNTVPVTFVLGNTSSTQTLYTAVQ